MTGSVSSSAGGRVGGATVTVLDGSNSGRTATANSTGDYRFDTMQAANGNFVARATGYQEARQGLFVNGTATLNFTLTPNPSFAGTWRGSARSQACSTEPPGLSSLCASTLSDTLVLTLTQNSTAVGANINFGGVATNTTGNANGTSMTLLNSSTVSSGTTIAYEDFNATVSSSGPTVSGTFTVRLSSGTSFVRFAMSFSGLTRSTTFAPVPASSASGGFKDVISQLERN